ncbi:MAG: ribosomal protein S18-alanine N-acetyltransferase [Elainella sp.]
MNFLLLQPLPHSDLAAAVDLDCRCLGGLWTENGYQREIDSPNSDLFGLYLQSHQFLQSHQSLQSQPALEQPNQQLALTRPGQESSILIGLACVWAILNEAHITLLAVDGHYRGQGLGQTLLYALLASAQQRQMEWATLEVRVSNQPAILLYQKFGFEQVGQRPGYYQDTGEAALILWRKGLQKPSFQTCLQQWRSEIELRLHRAHYQLSAPGLWGWSDQLAVEQSDSPDPVEVDYSAVSPLD